MRPDGISIKDLMKRQARAGEVTWIGLRSKSRQTVNPVDEVFAEAEKGLQDDHYSKAGGKRQVTLINREHLQAIASFLGKSELDPALLRRNLVIRGVNLLSLKNHRFRLGEAELEMSGECHPCSRMEENLGDGGYNAVRGHGGITARVISSGWICKSDRLILLE
jgi:MOSC domain-containing protein YiiM